MHVREMVAGAICAIGLIGFIGLALAAPRFDIVDGDYRGEVLSTRSGTTYKSFQNVELQLPDGRVFWVPVRASDVYVRGDALDVRVFCTDETYERCEARLWRVRAFGS